MKKEKNIIIGTTMVLAVFSTCILSDFLKREEHDSLDFITLGYTISAISKWALFLLNNGKKYFIEE